ncbi:MAG: hypothetical protein ACRENW_09045 [Thermodesulfobacteriota bacterium]
MAFPFAPSDHARADIDCPVGRVQCFVAPGCAVPWGDRQSGLRLDFRDVDPQRCPVAALSMVPEGDVPHGLVGASVEGRSIDRSTNHAVLPPMPRPSRQGHHVLWPLW